MKKFLTFFLLLILLFALVGCGGTAGGGNGNENNGPPAPPTHETVSAEGIRLKLTVGSDTLFVTLVDSAASRDLVARLKKDAMTLTFGDFAGSEKVAYPTPALDVSNTSGCDPVVGDLTIYKPWGNFAAFYRDTSGFSSSLTLIGRIEGEGIKTLGAQSGEFTAILELVK